ncbi:MAG: ABC transporter ATP-binding protein [Peptococcaceae bacterium]|nr:ABC transporter ATP-binding protein [Peptococcaceae bacterium]
MSLLELRAVTKRYRAGRGVWRKGVVVEAVADVSLALAEGACLGLIGESGCGKSTLGRIILGLEKPDRGEVLFQGKNLYRESPGVLRELRRDLQAVFQDCFSAVNPRHTAGQAILEPLRNYRRLSRVQEKRAVEELLEIVGLQPEDAEKYPHQFSGGQLQRVSIARAIALRPKLIVLDEAVSSLDMSVQAQVLNLLADLKEKFHLSYVFISHDIKAVYHLSDRLAVMCLGRVVEFIEDIRLIDELRHPYARKLLAAALPVQPQGRRQLDFAFDEPAAAQDAAGGCGYAHRCEMADPRCRTEVPPLKALGAKQRVACFYA